RGGRALRAEPGDVLRPLSARAARERGAPRVQPHRVTMRRLVVVGGGISGLSAAWAARRAAARLDGGLEVLVLERGAQVGGRARTPASDGWLVEAGPSGFLGDRPELDAMIDAVGLQGERVLADAASARRFIFARGRMRAVARDPIGLVRSGLL